MELGRLSMICRKKYSTQQQRFDLVSNLIKMDLSDPANFEEVKLVLGLAFQNGRWDGSDGGRGGYGDVLLHLAEAIRYEDGSNSDCATTLVRDMTERFVLLKPTKEQINTMQSVWVDCNNDPNLAQRRCSGLVLQALGFVEKGL
jgi:hypothetical protein